MYVFISINSNTELFSYFHTLISNSFEQTEKQLFLSVRTIRSFMVTYCHNSAFSRRLKNSLYNELSKCTCIYLKIQYWDQKYDISDEVWNCYNHSIQCVILSIKDSCVRKIIVKDGTQSKWFWFVKLGIRVLCRQHWTPKPLKKSWFKDLKRSKYVESFAKENLPWIKDISVEAKCKKRKFLI